MRRWFSFWGEHKRAILVAIGLLLLGALIGYIFWRELQEAMAEIFAQLVDKVGVKPGEEINSLQLFFGLFINNSTAVIILILSGFLFGIFPAWGMILNGMLIGYLMAATVNGGGNPFAMFLFGILPHGLFEFPALIIAASYGLVLGAAVFQSIVRLFRPDLRRDRPVGWKKILRPFFSTLLITLLLLVIAAAIESTITVYLVDQFISQV